MALYNASIGAADAEYVRCMVIYDRQPNGAYPAIADVLSVNDAGVAAGGVFTGLNITNKSRFLILADKVITLDPGSGQTMYFDIYRKLPRLEAQYKASAGTIADLSTGSILLLVFEANTVGANIGSCAALESRIRYFD